MGRRRDYIQSNKTVVSIPLGGDPPVLPTSPWQTPCEEPRDPGLGPREPGPWTPALGSPSSDKCAYCKAPSTRNRFWLDVLHFFFEENQRLEYGLQRFYSSMCFSNGSVFTEIFLKRTEGKRRGERFFSPVGRGLSRCQMPDM
ncbi:unnamed protein product [Arctogadus glacialis]